MKEIIASIRMAKAAQRRIIFSYFNRKRSNPFEKSLRTVYLICKIS